MLYHFLSQLAEFYLTHPVYSVTVVVCACVLAFLSYWAFKKIRTCDELPHQDLSVPRPGKGMYVLVGVTALLIAVGIALLLYPAWLKWDDFLFPENSVPVRIFAAVSGYFFRNSRSGEFIASLLAVSPSRWQVWLLNPLFVLANSFFLWRLLTPRHKSIFSLQGWAFLLFSSSAALVSCNIAPWRNFWCFAASANYLWPTIMTVFFLSLFNRTRPISFLTSDKYRRRAAVAVFILGLYCGCSVECLSVIIVPLLIVGMGYMMVCRKQFPTTIEKSAVLGYIWGTFFLFGSTSLYARAERGLQQLDVHLSEMSPPQLSQFLSELTWQSLDALKGAGGIIILKEVPLLKRIFFTPFLLDRFLVSSCVILTVIVILALGMLLFRVRPGRKALWSVAALFLLAFASAFSYGIQCIPGAMSFLPPCWFLLGAACMMFYGIMQRSRVCSCLMVAGMLALNAYLFIPGVVEAWQMKPLDQEMQAEIEARRGEETIVLHRPELPAVTDYLGLTAIHHYGLKDDPDAYPNNQCFAYFRVKRIAMDVSFPERTTEEYKEMHPIFPMWKVLVSHLCKWIFGHPLQPFC